VTNREKGATDTNSAHLKPREFLQLPARPEGQSAGATPL
jgi:hypothetical protein